MNGRRKRGLLAGLCLLAALLFAALGVWQVERRSWKLDLIARVDARIHAAPVAPPGQAEWSRIDPQAVEYRRVRVSGRFRHSAETRVDALTELGAGDWLLTPLDTTAGTILINRGFVPEKASEVLRPAGPVTVTGLMRLSEPHGRFLRPNQPRADRWFSRDVAAIARRKGLREVTPFFIDAEAGDGGTPPVGGLTVVSFRNAHLLYALTWFGLCLLSLTGLALVLCRAQEEP